MSIDAMKLALEALETDFVMPSEQWKAEDEAIKVLRVAIEQAEKQWIGLTDEEVKNIEISASSKEAAIYLAEAQLKGKNAL